MATDRWKRSMLRFATAPVGEGETVVYHPLGGSPRTITAIVDRQGPQEIASASAPRTLVTVLNDPLDGVDLANELNVGGDRIEIALRKGSSELQTRSVLAVEEGTQGDEMITLEVR